MGVRVRSRPSEKPGYWGSESRLAGSKGGGGGRLLRRPRWAEVDMGGLWRRWAWGSGCGMERLRAAADAGEGGSWGRGESRRGCAPSGGGGGGEVEAGRGERRPSAADGPPGVEPPAGAEVVVGQALEGLVGEAQAVGLGRLPDDDGGAARGADAGQGDGGLGERRMSGVDAPSE